MPCLNYIVASLRCAQCRKYATHLCAISFLVWLAVFRVCNPKRDAHIYIYTQSENNVTIMCLVLRRSVIIMFTVSFLRKVIIIVCMLYMLVTNLTKLCCNSVLIINVKIIHAVIEHVM